VRTVLEDGTTVYRNATAHSVRIENDVTVSAPTRFEKLRFAGAVRLSVGRLELHRCAAAAVISTAPAETEGEPPAIRLRDTLLVALTVANNIAELEYVTILGDAAARILRASEAILVGAIAGAGALDCVRYSRVPPAYRDLLPPIMQENALTSDAPRFLSTVYDQPGCGVLRQDAPASIARGAEDGGEMGAHHAWRHAAGIAALLDKLADHMPIGVEPVAVTDERLLCEPPALSGA
jgi:hypothetical protein